MAELKPCPFCGGSDIQSQADFVSCSDCGGQIDYSCEDPPLRDTAIAAWNRRASGWIPVGERLPDEHTKVLLLGRDGDMCIAYRTDDYWYDHNDGVCICDLRYGSHWMPLPAAPEVSE